MGSKGAGDFFGDLLEENWVVSRILNYNRLPKFGVFCSIPGI